MSLTLCYHPLASFCHKVLIALYENDTEFNRRIIDLGEQQGQSRATGCMADRQIPGHSRPCSKA